MKLNLNRKWFEDRISAEDNCEVGAGAPPEESVARTGPRVAEHSEDESVGTYAFGALVALLRRDRMLTVEQLAAEARISAEDLLNIEVYPRHVPNPRTVYQLAQVFKIPQRSLMKLSNLTTVHSERLRDAAVHFAASSSQVMDLTPEERAALTEFVHFLSSQDTD
jgi:hypothetical protein